MNCDNDWCIYQTEGKCTLNTVSIDNTGRCHEMIAFKIDGETLEKLKKDTLESYEDN